jgi:hypothetical protein
MTTRGEREPERECGDRIENAREKSFQPPRFPYQKVIPYQFIHSVPYLLNKKTSGASEVSLPIHPSVHLSHLAQLIRNENFLLLE